MSKLKLGVSPLTETVFVGKVNKKGNEWLARPPKQDITSNFISAIIQWVGVGATKEISADKPLYLISVIKADKDSIRNQINYLFKELEKEVDNEE